jgi:hypothetical protein
MNGLVTLGETEAGKALASLPHRDGVRQRWIAQGRIGALDQGCGHRA